MRAVSEASGTRQEPGPATHAGGIPEPAARHREVPRQPEAVAIDLSQGCPSRVGVESELSPRLAPSPKILALGNGDIIAFQALIRVSVPEILDTVTGTAHEIPLPFEFVLLDLKPS